MEADQPEQALRHLDLSRPRAQEALVELVRRADVLIENFRPGVMERWGLGYERLWAVNPGLVMLRMTGFGQFGPYASRPGFGTLAESMSGFAAITGEPDGPPTLPPFGLADCIAGITAAYAVMTALHERATSGAGQMIDLAIIEPIMAVLGNQALVYDQLGIVQPRLGNRSSNNAPRNTYRTRDGRWVAVSTSADRIAARVLELVGHPEVVREPWFATGFERAQHAEFLDELVGGWIAKRVEPAQPGPVWLTAAESVRIWLRRPLGVDAHRVARPDQAPPLSHSRRCCHLHLPRRPSIDLSRKASRSLLDERAGPLAVVRRPNQADSLLALDRQTLFER